MSTEPLSSVVSATAAMIALPNVLFRLVMLACSAATVLSSAAILAASFMVPGRDGVETPDGGYLLRELTVIEILFCNYFRGPRVIALVRFHMEAAKIAALESTVATLQANVSSLVGGLTAAIADTTELKGSVDTFYLLYSGALVFFMQARV